jgi:hypothetical protein
MAAFARIGSEDVRMAADHLVGDRCDDVGDREMAGFFGDARMEHDLKQQVAELVLEIRHIGARDRVGDFMRFLDRIGRDRLETLLDVPGAAMVGIAQTGHDRDQIVEWRACHEAAP